MKRLHALAGALLALLLMGPLAPAHAQEIKAITVLACGTPPNTPVVGSAYFVTMDPQGKLCVNASVSATATFTGYTPTGNATLTTSSTSARVALPSADTTALVRNTGTVDEWIAFGNGTVVATTGGTLIPAGQAVAFTIPNGATNIAGITGGSAGSLAVSTGTGTPVLTGGGSGSGGGGGGAVTAAINSFVDGYSVTLGAQADTACATDNGSCTGQALAKRANQRLTSLITALGSPFQAGGSIGNTTFASTIADGADVTMGAKADAAWTSGSGSLVALLKAIAGNTSGPIPAGSNVIGASYAYQNSSGNVLPPAADSSAPINVSTATTTQLVALSSGKKIYVSSFDVIAGGTGNITFEYGTGTNCGTGTTALTGAYNLTAQTGIAKGNGIGAVLVVPASNALCVLTSAAVQMSGSVAYSQF